MMKPANDPYGVSVDELRIDWESFASEVGRKSAHRARLRRSRGRAWRAAAAVAVLAVAIGFFFMRERSSVTSYDTTAYYSVPGEVKEYSMPKSFQALSGYPSDYDGAAMQRYMVGVGVD